MIPGTGLQLGFQRWFACVGMSLHIAAPQLGSLLACLRPRVRENEAFQADNWTLKACNWALHWNEFAPGRAIGLSGPHWLACERMRLLGRAIGL
jgi:hypothetical protein